MKAVILATGVAPRVGGVGVFGREVLPHLVPCWTFQGCQVWVLLAQMRSCPFRARVCRCCGCAPPALDRRRETCRLTP